MRRAWNLDRADRRPMWSAASVDQVEGKAACAAADRRNKPQETAERRSSNLRLGVVHVETAIGWYHTARRVER